MPSAKPKSTTIPISSKKQLDVANKPHEEDLSNEGLDERIEKLMKFFDYYGIKYDKFVPESRYFLDEKKKSAYPNYDQYIHVPGQRDVNKWLNTTKSIYQKQNSGIPYKEAIKGSTNGWNKMEIYDFLNWLRFYEEGSHMKYKSASVWYENGEPGYFLQVKPDTNSAEIKQINDEENAREEASRNEERKQIVEKQRQKIIGRLDSAEKLLRSQDGQEFAGNELESLMEAIYNLKKKIQLVNKISSSTRLYEDMIVREANVLKRNGFNKAAIKLYSLADAPPSVSPPEDPSGAGNPGIPGTLPAEIPGTPNAQTEENSNQPPASALNSPSDSAAPTDNTPKANKSVALNQFISNMNVGNKTDAKDHDELEVEDNDELEVEDSEDSLLVTEAQAAPGGIPPEAKEDVPMTISPAPSKLNPINLPAAEPIAEPTEPSKAISKPSEEVLEVSEDDIKPIEDKDPPSSSDFDSKVDEVFKNVTIADAVVELENISKSYKTREQPRRLSRVDMMLDSLGLASLFPSLSEAQNKALEANNYISTRVDDILAKLRGAMDSSEKTKITPDRPEVSGIKSKLENDQEKEKQRKQMRKEQENSELDVSKKETPEVEIDEDLGGATPAPVVPPPPIKAPAV